MSDDIFNEGRELNVGRILITVGFIVVLIILGLYFTDNLPLVSEEEEEGGNNIPQISNESVVEEPLDQGEKQELEEAMKKVVLIKYVTYKTDDGSVLEVRGYLGVKTEYYDNFLKDLIISVQNLSAKEVRVNKQVYKEDYKGYVIVSFRVYPISGDSINADKLNLLILYLNIPSKFTLDLSKNVKVVKGDYTIEMQYSVPKVVQSPVRVSVTFNVISKYPSKAKSVLSELESKCEINTLTMEGKEFKYTMKLGDCVISDNSITMTYISSPDVLSGVYELVFKYNLPSGEQVKNLGKVLVKNTASFPSLVDFSLEGGEDNIYVSYDGEQYKLILAVENYYAKITAPTFRVKLYDSSLKLVKEINLDNTVIDFGKNFFDIPIPEQMISSKSTCYLVITFRTPDGSMYSVVQTIDTSKLNVEQKEIENMADIKFMVYPLQFYASMSDVIFSENIRKVTLKVPIVVMYPSGKNAIIVTVTDLLSNEYTVTLNKVMNLRVGDGKVAPVFAGLIELTDIPLIENFVLNVKLEDGTELKGTVNLFNIYYSGGYLNKLFGEEIVKNPEPYENRIDSPEIYAFYVIADMKNLDAPVDAGESIYSILSNKILFNKEDVTITDGKLVINILGGTAEKIMKNNFVSYLPLIQEMIADMSVIIAQNENPTWRITLPVEAKFENGKIIIDAPYIESQKYVYLTIGENLERNLIPLNWVRDKPEINDSGFDYTIYTYLDQKLGVSIEEDLYSVSTRLYEDNPFTRTVLMEKINYIWDFSDYLYMEEVFGENSNTTNTYESNNTIEYQTNTTRQCYDDTCEEYGEPAEEVFYIGSDEPVTSAKLYVNGIEVPVKIENIQQLDFYLVQVKVGREDFIKTIKSASFSEVITGMKIIKLEVNGKIYYNILPYMIENTKFLVSGENIFVRLDSVSDVGLLKCDGTPLEVISEVIGQYNEENVVYKYSGVCKLTVKSDLFGELKIMP